VSDDSTAEKLARSLTADTTEIIPFLPYLLQDLWELGSSGQDMLGLLRRHVAVLPGFTALDLGCGKGAVSVAFAKELGIRCKGIDLLESFISEARARAVEHRVDGLCEFVVGDITQAVRIERDYDLVVFGAVGDVLGERADTLRALAAVIKPGGFIVVDDGYRLEGDDSALRFDAEYPTLQQWLTLIESVGLVLVAYRPAEKRPSDDLDFERIRCRAQELIRQFPQHREMFERYVENQRNEYDDLAKRVAGVTMLLREAAARGSGAD